MDNWEDIFKNWFNTTQQEFESFYLQINQDWQKNSEEWEKEINDLTEEIDTIVTTELDSFFTEVEVFVTEVIKLFLDEEYENDMDNFPYFNSEDEFNSWLQDDTVKPDSHNYPACIGCSNYHGRIYNGNLLVCAIHPYGWDDENCPDWQK